MMNWVKALFADLAEKSPVEQLEVLKKIGAFGVAGALLFGGYSLVFSKGGNNSDESDKFRLRAVIKDPDGFTYVRSMPSREGQIVAKVPDKEVFFTYEQRSNWWQVRTRDNRYGFMHITRIQVLGD